MEAVFAARAAMIGGAAPDVVIAVSPALLTVGAALRHRRAGPDGRGRRGPGPLRARGRRGRRAHRARGRVHRRAGAPAARRGRRGRRDPRALPHLAARPRRADSRITTIRNWSHAGLPGRPRGAAARARLDATTRSSRCTPGTWVPSRGSRTWSRPRVWPTRRAARCASSCSATATSAATSSARAGGSSAAVRRPAAGRRLRDRAGRSRRPRAQRAARDRRDVRALEADLLLRLRSPGGGGEPDRSAANAEVDGLGRRRLGSTGRPGRVAGRRTRGGRRRGGGPAMGLRGRHVRPRPAPREGRPRRLRRLGRGPRRPAAHRDPAAPRRRAAPRTARGSAATGHRRACASVGLEEVP